MGGLATELGDNIKVLINNNQKKVDLEKSEKISNFLKSIYGQEIFKENIDKLNSKLNLKIYVKIYKMVYLLLHQFLMELKNKM